jgi:hypothetical protein
MIKKWPLINKNRRFKTGFWFEETDNQLEPSIKLKNGDCETIMTYQAFKLWLDCKFYEKKAEIELKEKEMKRKAFESDKQAKIGSIIMSGAEGSIRALSQVPFPANIALVGLYGGMVAAQLAAVNSVPIPEFASGGIVPATKGGRIVKVAEAGQAEAIIPLDRFFNKKSGSSFTISVNSLLPNRETASLIVSEIKKLQREGVA